MKAHARNLLHLMLLLLCFSINNSFSVPKNSRRKNIKKNHVVETELLHDLIDSGVLSILNRREDYKDKRSDYVEPRQIFLIGTSHVSEQSAKDVSRVIEVVRPQSVVVELCRARKGILVQEEKEKNETADLSLMDIIVDGTSKGVKGSMLFQTVIARILSANIGSVRSGMDVRAANAGAKAVKAEILLGDRPIELTLQRAWKALSFSEKLMMGGGLMGSLLGLGNNTERTAEIVTLAKDGRMDDDLVESLMKELTTQYPSLIDPLVNERDAYLAWSLKRSKAVEGKARVVGVVGRGHVQGIIAAINRDNGGDTLVFKDLVREP